jgi:hypothetical protein
MTADNPKPVAPRPLAGERRSRAGAIVRSIR